MTLSVDISGSNPPGYAFERRASSFPPHCSSSLGMSTWLDIVVDICD